MSGVDDGGLAVAIFVLIVATVAVVLAMPRFLQWMATIRSWRRRRDPLRVLVSWCPHRDDAVIVSVSNQGDALLALGWCAVTASDGEEHLGPEVHEMPLLSGDSAFFLLERGAMPASGVRWTKLQVFDEQGHHASAPISRNLSAHLERS
jgi:hypothetical protein